MLFSEIGVICRGGMYKCDKDNKLIFIFVYIKLCIYFVK